MALQRAYGLDADDSGKKDQIKAMHGYTILSKIGATASDLYQFTQMRRLYFVFSDADAVTTVS